MAKHKLTPLEIKHAKCEPGRTLTRFSDGEGLSLVAHASGGKSWQFRYDYDKKSQTITVKGATVTDVRDEADRLRKMIAAGDDPKVAKLVERVAKVAANAQTFAVTKTAWIEREARRKQWTPEYVRDVENSLDRYLVDLNPLPVNKIVASITAPILHMIEKAGKPETAERLAVRLYAIMDFAVECGYLVQNPLPKRRAMKRDKQHYAAVTELPAVGEILRGFAGLEHAQSAVRAHVLLVFTAQRIGEIMGAKWAEFDLEAGTWAIPRERMKRKDEQRGDHLVPLAPALLAQVRAWREADGKGAIYVCPSVRNRRIALTADSLAKIYRDELGLTGRHSPHSWRAVFSTVCREAGKSGDVVEAQLDHVVGNQVAAAYDRSQRLELRRELMTWYESMMLAARDGATVLPLKKKGAA